MIVLPSRHKRKFRKKTFSELKDIARILIIDDKASGLVKPLKNEGWRASQIKDVANLNITELRDAHILCIDILGVGKKMSFPNEGLGLVRAIREEYPSKRILLYSSVSSHDIFDDAIDLVDMRLPKEGQPYPFIVAVHELAELAFDWDSCVADIYQRFREEIPDEMTEIEFNKKVRKCLSSNGNIDVEKLIKIAFVGVKTAKAIEGIMSSIP